MSQTVNADDLCARLAETGVQWDAMHWKRFLGLSPSEQQLVTQMLVEAEEPPPHSAWADVLTILQGVVAVAGAVSGVSSGVTGAISAIVAIRSIVKG